MAKETATLLASVFALALIAVDDDGQGAFHLMTKDDSVVYRVDDKERIQSGDSSRFMIWATKATGEEEVFENTDSYVFWKFNSADIYGDLKEGVCFDSPVSGKRIPFFSMNRNILEAQEVPCPPSLQKGPAS